MRTPMERKFEKLPQVINRTSLKKSSIYAKVGRGEFPQPIRLGKRSVVWISDEITRWIEERIEMSRNQSLVKTESSV
jgi:prophage regulatory protein